MGVRVIVSVGVGVSVGIGVAVRPPGVCVGSGVFVRVDVRVLVGVCPCSRWYPLKSDAHSYPRLPGHELRMAANLAKFPSKLLYSYIGPDILERLSKPERISTALDAKAYYQANAKPRTVRAVSASF